MDHDLQRKVDGVRLERTPQSSDTVTLAEPLGGTKAYTTGNIYVQLLISRIQWSGIERERAGPSLVYYSLDTGVTRHRKRRHRNKLKKERKRDWLLTHTYS